MKLRDILTVFNKPNDNEKQIKDLLKPLKTAEQQAAGRKIIDRAELLRGRVKADHLERVTKNQQKPQPQLIIQGANPQARQEDIARKEHARFRERDDRVLRARDSMLRELAGPRQERPPPIRAGHVQGRDTAKQENPTFRGAAAFAVAALAPDPPEAVVEEDLGLQQAQDGQTEPETGRSSDDEIVPGVTQADIDALTARLKAEQEAGRGIDTSEIDGPEIEP